MNLKIKLLSDLAITPSYATEGDAGLDLSSAKAGPEYIEPGKRALVGTGIAVEIPYGYVGLIHPRSGLAHKYGVTVLNTPGTIDAGYRGEVKVNLYNAGDETFVVEPKMRIAQLVIQKIENVTVVEADELSSSVRGAGGHGSTGV